MTTRRGFATRLLAALTGGGIARLEQGGVGPARVHDGLGVSNVREFGAKGDAATDDTTAIQAAIDARPDNLVWFPPGRYRVSRTLEVRAPVSLEGAGMRWSRLESLIDDGSPVLDVGHSSYREQIRDVTISNLMIRGPRGEPAPRSGGIRLHAFYDSLVQNVALEGLGWGIEGNRAISVLFSNIVVSGMRKTPVTTGEGLYLSGQSNTCQFDKLRVGNNEGAGFRLGNGQGCTLVAPAFESHQTSAIIVGEEQDGTLITCRAFVLVNPYFENNRPHDVVVKRGHPATITGGYWGPMHGDYVSPLLYFGPFNAIGCNFPAAPGGALRVTRANATGLFLGCSFGSDVASFSTSEARRTARLRVLDGERMVGGGDDPDSSDRV